MKKGLNRDSLMWIQSPNINCHHGFSTRGGGVSPQLPYDPVRDFSYLSLLTTAPLVLVGAASVPDGAAFFATASKSGDQWSYGSVGNGSVGHLGMELLKSKLKGFSPVHIPFQGNPAVMTICLLKVSE